MLEKSLQQGLVHRNLSVSVSCHHCDVVSTSSILACPAQSWGDSPWGGAAPVCWFDHSPLGARALLSEGKQVYPDPAALLFFCCGHSSLLPSDPLSFGSR